MNYESVCLYASHALLDARSIYLPYWASHTFSSLINLLDDFAGVLFDILAISVLSFGLAAVYKGSWLLESPFLTSLEEGVGRLSIILEGSTCLTDQRIGR